MEHIWLALLVIAIGIIIFYQPSVEKMTNEDLLATLKTFGEKGTKPKSKDSNEAPIYGPKAPKMADPTPAPSSNGKGDGTNTYPDIYGPEITPVPGQKKKTCKPGQHKSDCADDKTYQFNPDFKNAFPTEENEPQPFLTDFSKFQH
jgi:hypothetical protein